MQAPPTVSRIEARLKKQSLSSSQRLQSIQQFLALDFQQAAARKQVQGSTIPALLVHMLNTSTSAALTGNVSVAIERVGSFGRKAQTALMLAGGPEGLWRAAEGRDWNNTDMASQGPALSALVSLSANMTRVAQQLVGSETANGLVNLLQLGAASGNSAIVSGCCRLISGLAMRNSTRDEWLQITGHTEGLAHMLVQIIITDDFKLPVDEALEALAALCQDPMQSTQIAEAGLTAHVVRMMRSQPMKYIIPGAQLMGNLTTSQAGLLAVLKHGVPTLAETSWSSKNKGDQLLAAQVLEKISGHAQDVSGKTSSHQGHAELRSGYAVVSMLSSSSTTTRMAGMEGIKTIVRARGHTAAGALTTMGALSLLCELISDAEAGELEAAVPALVSLLLESNVQEVFLTKHDGAQVISKLLRHKGHERSHSALRQSAAAAIVPLGSSIGGARRLMTAKAWSALTKMMASGAPYESSAAALALAVLLDNTPQLLGLLSKRKSIMEEVKVLILSPNAQQNTSGMALLLRLAKNSDAFREFDDAHLIRRLLELANGQNPMESLSVLRVLARDNSAAKKMRAAGIGNLLRYKQRAPKDIGEALQSLQDALDGHPQGRDDL